MTSLVLSEQFSRKLLLLLFGMHLPILLGYLFCFIINFNMLTLMLQDSVSKIVALEGVLFANIIF